MGEIRVNVTAGKSQKVTVSSQQTQTEILASADMGQYWSQNSKNWAVSENIVDNADYSSKYYANKSKENAETAKSYANTAKTSYENFVSESDGYITDIEEKREIGLQELDTKHQEIEAELDTKKTQAVKDIQATSNTAINTLTQEVEQGKKEVKQAVGDIKVLTTLEIGDIGIAPLGIDEAQGKRRYLNGQTMILDNYPQFRDWLITKRKMYPSAFVNSINEYNAIVSNSDLGQCGKFYFDQVKNTVRLPKVVNIQGLTDLSKLGAIVEAGLPNITGQISKIGGIRKENNSTGALYDTATTYSHGFSTSGSTTEDECSIGFDASLSNPIYGNSRTVQQEQIQYPYFIQVATGAEVEDNIINEIELNNPFSLLDYKYSEYELNNLSWLRSNGQYNSKAIYTPVYDLLLKIYNGTETKAGVSVKLTTEDYSDVDFVLNTAEETFRLPVKVKLASGKAVVGNGMTLGLNNGTSDFGFVINDSAEYNYHLYSTGIYGMPVGTIASSISGNANVKNPNASSIGVTTDPTKSGIETSDSDLYLYFYVGETVQNANLINAGRIEESLINHASQVHIVETYQNGTSWYRVYSDGWCEQGGRVPASANGALSITFLKSYKNTDYNIDCGSYYGTSAGSSTSNSIQNQQAWNVTVSGFSTYGLSSFPKYWKTCGYIA